MSVQPTLSQFLLRHVNCSPEHRDFVLMLLDIATIGKFISRETNRAGLAGILGATGSANIQGEHVQKLDEFTNELCKNYLRETGHFAALASEEEDGVVDMGVKGAEARYIIAFDPLDGSSNIDVNVSIGTIFSIHRRLENIERTSEQQFLQAGKDQVMAGYILYGSSTVMVFTLCDGVHEFTLDQGLGEFMLSRTNMRIPDACGIYSVNEGNAKKFSEADRSFITLLKQELNCGGRYIGSLVADFHRNLIKGGVFLYPKVDKGGGVFEGKLRLNFEAKPMAFIAEKAGGLAVADSEAILNIVPTSLHQRVPLVVGNKDVVQQYMVCLAM